jgi:hypothetical protein
MSTSGTVGLTVINTASVIEHALRRCGLNPNIQTAETVTISRECLYLLLTHYANKGLNLWCISRELIGYVPGQRDYLLPVGTNDVLNQLHCTPSLISGTLAGNTYTFDSSSTCVRVGIKFSVLPVADFTIAFDGGTLVSVDYTFVTSIGVVYWYSFDPSVTATFISVSSGTVSAIYCANKVTEIPITPINRDTYQDFPNKDFQSGQVTSSYFNKTLNPSLTFWPVPDGEIKHAAVVVHRQIQDVGTLTQQLAIPQRWFEATIIQLAFRLALELPGVDSGRVTLLSQLADRFQIEAENEETDSAPIYLQPNIRGYTR